MFGKESDDLSDMDRFEEAGSAFFMNQISCVWQLQDNAFWLCLTSDSAARRSCPRTRYANDGGGDAVVQWFMADCTLREGNEMIGKFVPENLG